MGCVLSSKSGTVRLEDFLDNIIELREFDVPYHNRFCIDTGDSRLAVVPRLHSLTYTGRHPDCIPETRRVCFIWIKTDQQTIPADTFSSSTSCNV